jgi:hypothetical protein
MFDLLINTCFLLLNKDLWGERERERERESAYGVKQKTIKFVATPLSIKEKEQRLAGEIAL